jgi:hypothetical protein
MPLRQRAGHPFLIRRRAMKRRIAVLALLSFVFSIAAAPLARADWSLWPKESLLASTTEPATPDTPRSGAPGAIADIKVLEAGESNIEETIPPPVEGAAPAEDLPAADAFQAGRDGGDRILAGFFEGSRGKWITIGAGILAIVLIAVASPDGGTTTTNH